MNTLFLATIGDSFDNIFYNFDLWVFQLFGSIQSDFMTTVAKVFTAFGDENFIIPIAILSIILCFFKKTRKIGFSIILAIAIGTILTNVVFKPLVLRVRPYTTLQNNAEYFGYYEFAGRLSENDYSFPSGHTTGIFEIVFALTLYLSRDKKKKYAWLLMIIPVLTMCSRVYLMVHYATDVIGGMLIGLFAGGVGYALASPICKIKGLDKLDAGKLFKKAPKWLGAVLIIIALIGTYCYSFIPAINEGNSQICAYVYEDGKQCYNAAKVDDDKYPAIDGKNYCKIHWKELSQEQQ